MGRFIEVSSGTEISIEPFLSENGHFGLKEITLSEKLGGEVPFCYAVLTHDGSQSAKELMEEEDTVVSVIIKQDNTEIYSFQGFIVHRTLEPVNFFEFNIAIIPEGKKELVTTQRSISWKNIPEAIEKIWLDRKYPADIQRPFEGAWPPANLEDTRVYQVNETDTQFLSKICSMLKENCVYGFTFDGLLVKDLVGGLDRFGKKEPTEYAVGGGNVSETEKNPRYANRNIELKKGIKDPTKDLSHKEISKNFDVRLWNDKWSVIRKGYSLINKNRTINEKILNSTLGLSLSIQETDKIPGYKLGDTILYIKGSDLEVPKDTEFIITEISITINIADPDTPAQTTSKKGLTWEALIRSTRELNKVEENDKTV